MDSEMEVCVGQVSRGVLLGTTRVSEESRSGMRRGLKSPYEKVLEVQCMCRKQKLVDLET